MDAEGALDLAGRVVVLGMIVVGAAASLWWCFAGPDNGWGLYAPVAAGPLLTAAAWRLGTRDARKTKRLRDGSAVEIGSDGVTGGARTAFLAHC